MVCYEECPTLVRCGAMECASEEGGGCGDFSRSVVLCVGAVCAGR